MNVLLLLFEISIPLMAKAGHTRYESCLVIDELAEVKIIPFLRAKISFTMADTQ